MIALALTVLTVALWIAPAGQAGLAGLTPITLEPITVANGIATISGSVAAGSSDQTATLTINGQPLGVTSDGRFDATVNLDGQSQIELALNGPEGEQSVLRIPVSLLGGGGTVPASALQPLTEAGVQVSLPPSGFVSADAGPVTVQGRVSNPDSLLSLTVNGQQVTPGPDGGFTTTAPAGTRQVTVVATGTNGVSQTTSFPISQFSSTIQTTQGTSVSAAGADGVVIARVAYNPNRSTKAVRMIVTVKDRRGYLVRDAVVRVNALPGRALLGGVTATTTNRVGKATLLLRPRAAMFGAKLTTRTVAKTPKATATRITAVKLPRLAR